MVGFLKRYKTAKLHGLLLSFFKDLGGMFLRNKQN